MRYRRSQVRYALIITSREPNAFGDPWSTGPGVALAQPCFRPRADLYESADSFSLLVDLAGVDAENLDVGLHPDALVIEGSRRLPAPAPGGYYHSAEIPQGPFRLVVTFPVPIDTGRVEGHYDRGVLRLSLAKGVA